ncbi:MAG: LPS export ABC transporter permease LptF [Gammaproteobacteria bacterium RIFCSPHIGHO2_02_FULL_42_13]|nr:MAG: LPS export ABC transporter permease LptF [Gammaproteobacteria bacterium RIFCSPHIGHO2_02_FULL_42_13]OGT68941.1 MAG: LPS export ABC transporter permease LptF [Gammaproteobacteria bacterium RIFCSPLOWO2_02_FULL_42_9]
MKIITRYLTKEVLNLLLAITTVIVFIFMCNQFVRYLGFVASGKYAANMLFRLVLCQVPILYAMLLPLGLYLGILLGYGRLYADSEMTVLLACGLSRRELFKITTSYTLFVALVIGILAIWVNPIVQLHRDQLMDLAESSTVFQTLMPGRFQTTKSGDKVFYVKAMSRDRQSMNDVFIAQTKQSMSKIKTSDAENWTVISAKHGYERVDPHTGEHYLVTDTGYQYEGVPGQHAFRVIKYSTYGVRMSPPVFSGHNVGEEALPTAQLIRQWKKLGYAAELEWRLSMPLSVIILGLLGVPLSRVNPRQGRFARLVPAVLIYIIYVNMLFVSRSWLERGKISPWLGVWWVHGLFLLLAWWLWSKDPMVSARPNRCLSWLI